MKKLNADSHKALINLDSHSVLHHIIENFINADIFNFIPIVGHNFKNVLSCFDQTYSKNINVHPIYNKHYSDRNNLYSLYCARKELEGNEFILCNGDMVFDRRIVKNILSMDKSSAIAIDDSSFKKPIDSPGVILKQNRIMDLGRHIPFDNNDGYAIGIYKFNKDLTSVFFNESEIMLKSNLNAGFHDPLIELFKSNLVNKCSTKEYLWTDIDEDDDVIKARRIHQQIKLNYENSK